MQVICLEEEAFFELIEKVVERIESREKKEEKWVNTEKAMEILCIKSKSTLQEYRDNNEIIFTQPRKKIILYDRYSLEEFNVKYQNKKK